MARTQAGDRLEKLRSRSEEENLRIRSEEEKPCVENYQLGDCPGCSYLPPHAQPPSLTPCKTVRLDVIQNYDSDDLMPRKRRMTMIMVMSLQVGTLGGIGLTHIFSDNGQEACLTTETSLNLIAEK